MPSSSFTFPPPPPPPPRRDSPQTHFNHSQSERGREYGVGRGESRATSLRGHPRGLQSAWGQGPRRSHYGPGLRGNEQTTYFGYPSRDGGSRQLGNRHNWSEATRGGTSQNYGHRHHGVHQPLSGLYRPPPRDIQLQPGYPSPPSSTDQPLRKRTHGSAFPKANNSNPRPRAPPEVPSFGAGLPLSFPLNPPTSSPSVTRTQPLRKHNQLGLTPATLEHESSSSDEDEEVKLAPPAAHDALQVEYKGRTFTLRTAADIASWIAERRKKYPTLAKADAAKKETAEKKQRWEEEKKRRQEIARARQEKQQQQRRTKQENKATGLEHQKTSSNIQEKNRRKQDVTAPDGGLEADDEFMLKRAQLKAEILRRRALKAEMAAVEAEAAVLAARNKQANLNNNPTQPPAGDQRAANENDINLAVVREGEKSAWRDNGSLTGQEKGVVEEDEFSSSPSLSSLSLSVSESSHFSDSDETSSAESSTSSDSESDSAPEETSSRRVDPDRVPPPPRRPKLCRHFIKTGRCRYGKDCQFSHDPSTSRKPPREKPGTKEKARRKGLWQVFVGKELAEGRKQLLRAIISMGERGLLDGEER